MDIRTGCGVVRSVLMDFESSLQVAIRLFVCGAPKLTNKLVIYFRDTPIRFGWCPRVQMECSWCIQTKFQKQLFGIAAAERLFGDQKQEHASAINTITNIDAENIIRSCCQKTPHFWPSSFPDYDGELHCKRYALYSSITGERILLGNFPSDATDAEYEESRKVIVAGLTTGAVAFCRLIAESQYL